MGPGRPIETCPSPQVFRGASRSNDMSTLTKIREKFGHLHPNFQGHLRSLISTRIDRLPMTSQFPISDT